MALTTGQVLLSSTAPTQLFIVPAGWASVTIRSSTASTALAFAGPGSAITTLNGAEIPPGGFLYWRQEGPSRGTPIYGVTSSASAATLSWLVSTAE